MGNKETGAVKQSDLSDKKEIGHLEGTVSEGMIKVSRQSSIRVHRTLFTTLADSMYFS